MSVVVFRWLSKPAVLKHTGPTSGPGAESSLSPADPVGTAPAFHALPHPFYCPAPSLLSEISRESTRELPRNCREAPEISREIRVVNSRQFSLNLAKSLEFSASGGFHASPSLLSTQITINHRSRDCGDQPFHDRRSKLSSQR